MSDQGSGQPTRLLTVNEAAAFLSMHPGSVRRLVQEGRLPAYRLGPGQRGRLRVREADLVALLRATGERHQGTGDGHGQQPPTDEEGGA